MPDHGILNHLLCILPLVLSVCCSVTNSSNVTARNPTVVLLSFDGFRWDYIDKYNLTAFKYLAGHGVKAESLKPCFITKTFPNHVTLVTGLYEESHGIVGNSMYDPLLKSYFNVSTHDPRWFQDYTPIWISNEHHQANEKRRKDVVPRKSGAIFWPTSVIPFNGSLPSFYFPVYSETYAFSDRFAKISELLQEAIPYNFIAAYFTRPDKVAHRHGPDSKEVVRDLRKIDGLLHSFIKSLEQKDLLDKINLIIVSDHGMAAIPPGHHIFIDTILPPSWYDAVGIGVISSIYPKAGYEKRVFDRLSSVSNITVYRKHDIPERYHYRNHRRVPPIIAVADLDYMMLKGNTKIDHMTGNHGYDNDIDQMHGIFVAHGPAFRKNLTIGMVQNTDVYGIMCYVLGIRPLPNNGSLERVMQIFEVPSSLFSFTKHIVVLVIVCALSLGLAAVVCAYLVCCWRRRALMRHISQSRYTKITAFSDDFDSALSSDEDTF